MKHIFCILTGLLLSTSFTPGVKPVNLSEALAQNLVKLTVSGNGTHSGKCIKASIQNTGKGDISINIPAGTYFTPDDSTMQDILIVKGANLIINKAQTKSIDLIGFCARASKRSPSSTASFNLAKPHDPKLLQIAEFLDKNSFPEQAMQSAVWAVSDDHNISEIYDENPVGIKALRSKVAEITGQKEVWYTTQVLSSIDERGYIKREPVLVTGDMIFALDAPAQLTQEVCKENGEVVWKVNKTMELHKSSSINLKFKLRVSSWEKGNYYVRGYIPGKTIFKQEFKI